MSKTIPSETGKNYFLMNGDCVECTRQLPDESIDFMVFSPPFANLYIYSDDIRDMGNCKGMDEFFAQYGFLSDQLYRVLRTGRLMAVHCKQIVRYKGRDGVSGWTDFRGELIRHYEQHGFTYHSEVVIWTDPVLEMQKTKTQRLLYCQLQRDASHTGIGIPEYLLIFRKWDETKEDQEIPIRHYKNERECKKDGGDESQIMDLETWQRYASPVWFDIRRTDVLNARIARDDQDEKHLCFAEGTLVLTKRGYVPIESVIPMVDETLTHNGRWKKIVAKAKTGENADVVQTVAHGVPKLISTPDHKLMAKKCVAGADRKYSIENAEAKWTEAKDCERHFLLSVLPPVMDSEIPEDEWWVIGRWLADGHVDAREHQFIVSIGNGKLAEFEQKARKFIGHKYNNGSATQIGLVNLSEVARNFLRRCGKGAENKVIPVEGISLNKELSEALLSGYMSGDGFFEKNGKRYYATSVSRALLLGLAIVAQRARGMCPAVYAGRPERESMIEGRKVHCRQEWNLVFGSNYSYARVEQFSAWKPVKTIENKGKANVWSIEVEDDHSYTAEGCVVKNCPLQLPVIERAIRLWTNPGETVLTPFMGIGSEAYMAVKMGRKAVGIELKESYYRQAVANVKSVAENNQGTLFDMIGEEPQ